MTDTSEWMVFNRQVSVDKNVVHLDAKEGAGVVKLNDFIMGDGVVELDRFLGWAWL